MLSSLRHPIETLKALLPHKKRCYLFHEAGIEDKALLGNKGANLCEMVKQLKLPVPPGFVITTEACLEFLHDPSDPKLSQQLLDEYTHKLHEISRQCGRTFGVSKPQTSSNEPVTMPLLLSVRSGAAGKIFCIHLYSHFFIVCIPFSLIFILIHAPQRHQFKIYQIKLTFTVV